MLETEKIPEPSDTQIHQSPLHLKFLDSFFASAALLLFIVISGVFLPDRYLDAIDSAPTLGFLFQNSFWLFGLLFGIGYSTFWHSQEKTEPFPAGKRQAYCRAILRYSLCYIIAGYGFGKLLGIQFGLTMNMQDVPLDQLNGFFLTWYYFYYSRPFTLIIAFFEITGSVLLLFRRTTLLGVFILVPVMTNVTLIDYFYGVPGPFKYALFMTGGLIYLLSLHGERLEQLLLHTVDYLPKISNKTPTNLLRLAILVLAFLSVLQWITPMRKEKTDTTLQGKWKVEQQTVNGNPVSPGAWEKDATVSVWSNLYLEEGYFTVSVHPYVFDPKKAKFGTYSHNALKKELTVKFSERGKEEVVNFTVDSTEADRMTLSGTLKGDRATLSLARVKPLKTYRLYLDW
jgi:hypothetical protein